MSQDPRAARLRAVIAEELTERPASDDGISLEFFEPVEDWRALLDERMDLLRRLWRLSQQGRMIIWVAGEIQDLVMEALGTEEPFEAERLLFGE